MKQITFNPSNEPYYSDDFIKGFECGAKRQFEADKKARPKEGEWIDTKLIRADGDTYEVTMCNQCGFCASVQTNFCPNCGADMRERKDFQVIVNGNCTKCGKPLSGNRIFICEDCEEQSKESE